MAVEALTKTCQVFDQPKVPEQYAGMPVYLLAGLHSPEDLDFIEFSKKHILNLLERAQGRKIVYLIENDNQSETGYRNIQASIASGRSITEAHVIDYMRRKRIGSGVEEMEDLDTVRADLTAKYPFEMGIFRMLDEIKDSTLGSSLCIAEETFPDEKAAFLVEREKMLVQRDAQVQSFVEQGELSHALPLFQESMESWIEDSVEREKSITSNLVGKLLLEPDGVAVCTSIIGQAHAVPLTARLREAGFKPVVVFGRSNPEMVLHVQKIAEVIKSVSDPSQIRAKLSDISDLDFSKMMISSSIYSLLNGIPLYSSEDLIAFINRFISTHLQTEDDIRKFEERIREQKDLYQAVLKTLEDGKLFSKPIPQG